MMTDQRYEPIDSGVTPRFAGHSTFMRLPVVSDPRQLDIAIVGVPWDGGTTNRPGPRHGPRQVREMSSMIKRVHSVTKISPYELCRVADVGDAPVNPIDLNRSLESIQGFFVFASDSKGCRGQRTRGNDSLRRALGHGGHLF